MKMIDLEGTVRKAFANRPNDAYSLAEVFAQFRRWHAQAYRCVRGDICVRNGTPATEFLMVVSGVLHLKISTETGDDIIIRAIRPGEYAGLTHLFSDGAEHNYDAIAAKPSEIITFNSAEVRRWRTDPASVPLFDFLWQHLSLVCREAQRKATILAGSDIAERLRRYLAIRMQSENSRTIAIPGTSRDLASYLGVNNCALSRVIGKLRAEGKFTFERNVFAMNAPA